MVSQVQNPKAQNGCLADNFRSQLRLPGHQPGLAGFTDLVVFLVGYIAINGSIRSLKIAKSYEATNLE